MNETLTLKTAGYRIDFDFQPHPKIEEGLRGRIRLIATLDFEPHELETKEFLLLINDLLGLATYLEDHISNLMIRQSNQDYAEAYLFLDDSLAYQIRALNGWVGSNMRGSFSIEVLVKVGFDRYMNKAVYAGIKTTVDVVEVTRFIRHIRESFSKQD